MQITSGARPSSVLSPMYCESSLRAWFSDVIDSGLNPRPSLIAVVCDDSKCEESLVENGPSRNTFVEYFTQCYKQPNFNQ